MVRTDSITPYRFERYACLSGYIFLNAFGFAFLSDDGADCDGPYPQLPGNIVDQNALSQQPCSYLMRFKYDRFRPFSFAVIIKVQIISDNPKHKVMEAPIDQVHINGKVIWFGRDVERR